MEYDLKRSFVDTFILPGFLTTWLMSPQYSLILKNKIKNVQNMHAAATAL